MRLKNKEKKIVDINIDEITDINVTISDNFMVFCMTIFRGSKKSDFFYAYNNDNLTEFFIEIMKEFKKKAEKRGLKNENNK
ncbi:hypothetical protein [Streptobacillus moniliformis]|uniref:hypothetical protein n=1 Tax=Streptobacillus moniliformis TaxID=34105 RepID=UPI0007E488EA|nr:hypothetical protein [Streptobacillus moniliformis]